MPTKYGSETINERLERLRSELSRVRTTLSRAEQNGQSNELNGTQVTEIAYDRALRRQSALEQEVFGLERRLAGKKPGGGAAIIKTVEN